MQLVHVPLLQRLQRTRKHISYWKHNSKNNTGGLISILRGRLDRAICSNTATNQEKSGTKRRVESGLLGNFGNRKVE